MTSIFEYLFIKSEFTVVNIVSTPCFNEEENSFVLIEYKKVKTTVIDQGYTYLQLLLNNKSTFTLLLSQYYNKVLKSMILIGSIKNCYFLFFNSYQRDSVNFKDLPFEPGKLKNLKMVQ